MHSALLEMQLLLRVLQYGVNDQIGMYSWRACTCPAHASAYGNPPPQYARCSRSGLMGGTAGLHSIAEIVLVIACAVRSAGGQDAGGAAARGCGAGAVPAGRHRQPGPARVPAHGALALPRVLLRQCKVPYGSSIAEITWEDALCGHGMQCSCRLHGALLVRCTMAMQRGLFQNNLLSEGHTCPVCRHRIEVGLGCVEHLADGIESFCTATGLCSTCHNMLNVCTLTGLHCGKMGLQSGA